VPKSHQKHLEVKGAGHYGIFAGRRWRETAYPEVRDFIARHNTGPTVSGAGHPAAGKATARKKVVATSA
jgi:poly(3-hydroxybutyrate) depolymerase